MNSSKVYASLAGCALAVAGLSGCFITPDTGPGPGPLPVPAVRTGTVTLTWTVAGSHSPPACAQFGADDFELAIHDRAGRSITTVIASCADFTLTVPLPPGSYEGEATLVDSRSRAMSTTLPVHDIQIISGSDLTVDIDFPSTSRL